MAVAFNKVNAYSFDLCRAKHDWSTHVYKAMLSNTAPTATSAVKADLTEIAPGNGYSAGGVALAVTLSQSGLVTKITIADNTITAAGGTIGPFRYVAIYNDTQSSPVKPIVGWYDNGSPITLQDGEPFVLDFDNVNGFGTQT